MAGFVQVVTYSMRNVANFHSILSYSYSWWIVSISQFYTTVQDFTIDPNRLINKVPSHHCFNIKFMVSHSSTHFKTRGYDLIWTPAGIAWLHAHKFYSLGIVGSYLFWHTSGLECTQNEILKLPSSLPNFKKFCKGSFWLCWSIQWFPEASHKSFWNS